MDIKKLDAQIAALLEQRARLVAGRQDAKSREKVFPTEAKMRILKDIASVCEALVRPKKVAFLGPLYSYTHLATERFFGKGIDRAPVVTIEGVFAEVRDGQSDFGVVPLENSTDGRVVDTLEMFTTCPVRICGEVELPIHHALLAACRREEITEVQSKPQALSQCRHWLLKHLPGVKLTEVSSTAAAAKNAKSRPNVAAVASPMAAEAYGLSTLADAIEDNPRNVTRFVVVGKDVVPSRSKEDKTTLMFHLPHTAGSLADAMMTFRRHHVNLTWIESFPIPGEPGAYLFFVTLEGHCEELKVRRVLAQLEKKTDRLTVLGSYPAAKKT
ncbi:MAG: prephenate dehydratase [Planctomycetia bacterium]|nr:prephenate dehydratase [Planctomycetia bacterium]